MDIPGRYPGLVTYNVKYVNDDVQNGRIDFAASKTQLSSMGKNITVGHQNTVVDLFDAQGNVHEKGLETLLAPLLSQVSAAGAANCYQELLDDASQAQTQYQATLEPANTSSSATANPAVVVAMPANTTAVPTPSPSTPFYKNKYFWIPVVAGTVVLGAGLAVVEKLYAQNHAPTPAVPLSPEQFFTQHNCSQIETFYDRIMTGPDANASPIITKNWEYFVGNATDAATTVGENVFITNTTQAWSCNSQIPELGCDQEAKLVERLTTVYVCQSVKHLSEAEFYKNTQAALASTDPLIRLSYLGIAAGAAVMGGLTYGAMKGLQKLGLIT